MDQFATRHAAVPVLTVRAATGADGATGHADAARASATPAGDADRGGRLGAGLGAGCLHAVMLAVMAYAMLDGHSTGALAAGLALTALAMSMAPFARRSWRIREHLLDLGAMVAVLVLPWLVGGSVGSMAGHGMSMTAGGTTAGAMTSALPVMVAVVVVWLVARGMLFVATGHAGSGARAGSDRARRANIAAVMSASVTGIGLIVMLVL